MSTSPFSNQKYIALILFLLLVLVSTDLLAQTLSEYNQSRLDINKSGMIILGGWAAGNLLINPIIGRNATGSDKYFYQMNAWWNAVNLTIAGFGYYNAIGSEVQTLDALASLQE